MKSLKRQIAVTLISLMSIFLRLLRLTFFVIAPMIHTCLVMSLRISVEDLTEKFTGKYLCLSLFLNKVAGLRTPTLLKKILCRRCFLENFAKCLRTIFYTRPPVATSRHFQYSDSQESVKAIFQQFLKIFCHAELTVNKGHWNLQFTYQMFFFEFLFFFFSVIKTYITGFPQLLLTFTDHRLLFRLLQCTVLWFLP